MDIAKLIEIRDNHEDIDRLTDDASALQIALLAEIAIRIEGLRQAIDEPRQRLKRSLNVKAVDAEVVE
jgi:hypothetical protein